MFIRDYFEDAERYFQQDCYCPNEVYDLTGIFFKLYYPEDQYSYIMTLSTVYDDCDLFIGISKGEFLMVAVISTEDNEFNLPVGSVVDMQRIPISMNNYLALKDILNNVPDEDRHSLNPDEDSLESLNKLISISDAIMIS